MSNRNLHSDGEDEAPATSPPHKLSKMVVVGVVPIRFERVPITINADLMVSVKEPIEWWEFHGKQGEPDERWRG